MTLQLPTRLKREIGQDPSRLVVWVGAGLSKNGVREGGKGLPDAKALAAGMITHLREKEVSSQVISAMEDFLRANKHAKIADRFVKHTSLTEFAVFLRHCLDPNDLAASKIHDLLVSIGFRGIFTTNFDRVIESHLPEARVLRYPRCLDYPGDFAEPGVLVKIHGCVSDPDPQYLVMTTEGYSRLDRDDRYQTILTTYFAKYPILTLGYSANDRDFLALRKKLGQIFCDRVPSIYAVMLNPDPKSLQRLRRQKVDVIPYTQRHELRHFLAELLTLSEKLRPSPARVTRPPAAIPALRSVKAAAWDVYSAWRRDIQSGRSRCRALGSIVVNRRGWRHMTRVRVPAPEIAHRLSLLAWAREIVEGVDVYRELRWTKKRTIRLVSLEGVYESRYQPDILVQVVIEQRYRTGDAPINTLVGVYERRYSVERWKRERVPSIR